MTSAPATSLAARLRDIQHVALDMDGTLYRGRTLFDWTLPFLGRLERICIGYTFLTNNSSRSARDYVEHLKGMGIRVSAEDIVPSDACPQERPPSWAVVLSCSARWPDTIRGDSPSF